jgi:hypothetical protein
MFVWINFLSMIKIGIIGSDKHLMHLANLVRNTEDLELAGCFNDYYDNFENILPDNLATFSSLESLLRHVDAVVVNCNSEGSVAKVCQSLKHFKHVFLMEAQYLKYKDYSYILKIAEESNVKFYPEFGNIVPESIEKLIDGFEDVQFVDVNQTFSPTEGICEDGRLSLALLRNIAFVGIFLKSNVKKINTNGWGFCEPGAGMLNAKIDFDNGASANLLLANSANPCQTQVVLYGRSEIVRINVLDNIFKVSRESLSKGQLGSFEKIYPAESFLKHELKLFYSAIQQNRIGLNAIDNSLKSIRTTFLIHEKINHIASINIFYS